MIPTTGKETKMGSRTLGLVLERKNPVTAESVKMALDIWIILGQRGNLCLLLTKYSTYKRVVMLQQS